MLGITSTFSQKYVYLLAISANSSWLIFNPAKELAPLKLKDQMCQMGFHQLKWLADEPRPLVRWLVSLT